MSIKKRTGRNTPDCDRDEGIPDERSRFGDSQERRGVSEVVGVIILFGIVMVGVGLILVSGFGATEEVQDNNELQAAETSMQEFRGEMTSMAYENQSTTEFELAGDNTEQVGVVEDGYIEFSLNGLSQCTANRSMGMVKFEQGDGDLVAYQANGVWKKTNEGGSVMVEAPDMQYRTETVDGAEFRTLNYPLVNVNASESEFGRAPEITVRDTEQNMREAMETEMCLRGSDTDQIDSVNNVTIRIQNSTFYDAWANYFNQTFGPHGRIVVFPGNNSVFALNVSLGLVPGSCTDRSPGVSLEVSNESPSGEYRNHVVVEQNESVFLNGGANDPDNCGNGIVNRSITGPGGLSVNTIRATYRWASTGIKTVTLWVEDDEGNTETTTVTVNVTSADPDGGGGSDPEDDPVTASLDVYRGGSPVTGDPIEIDVNQQLRFEGTASDGDDSGPDPQIRNETITGFGFAVDGDTATKSWSDPGLYTVAYYAEDNEGNVVTETVTVEVTEPGSDDPSNPGGPGGPPDGDGDGIPDGIDECPGEPGTGENGCSPISREDGGLRVNQSSGTLTFLGSQITRRNVTEGADRQPMDVMFVLDETGSMITGDRKSGWQYRSSGTYTAPSDRTVEVCRYDPSYGCVDIEYYVPGETYSVDDDYVRFYEPGNDPYERRVGATESFIGELDGTRGDRAGIVHFDTDADVTSGLTGDLDAANASIQPDPGGATDMSTGLEEAIEEHRDTGGPEEDVIVLLSDGENTVSGADGRTENLALEAANEDITIYTVGLGTNIDSSLLEYVASTTGGEFYQVDDADDLEDVFEEIAGEEREPVKRVEYGNVSTEIDIEDSPNATEIDVGDVNVPDDPGEDEDVDAGEPGWLLSLTVTLNECEEREETGNSEEYDGDEYNETKCNGSTPVDTIDGEDADHRIFLDGEPVPDMGADEDKPWKEGLEEILDEHGLVQGAANGTRFDLGPNQAVVVTQFSPGNFTVALFEADDSDPPSYSCAGGNPNASLEITPGTTVAPDDPVTINGTAVDTGSCSGREGIDESAEEIRIQQEDGSTTAIYGNETVWDWDETGIYRVTYVAVDYEGNRTPVQEIVTVNETSGGGGSCVDATPSADLGSNETIPTETTVTVQAAGYDNDACTNGTTSASLEVDGRIGDYQVTTSWSTPGNYTATFEFVDEEGNVVTDQITITVVESGGGGGDAPGVDDGFVIGIGGDEVVVDDDD